MQAKNPKLCQFMILCYPPATQPIIFGCHLWTKWLNTFLNCLSVNVEFQIFSIVCTWCIGRRKCQRYLNLFYSFSHCNECSHKVIKTIFWQTTGNYVLAKVSFSNVKFITFFCLNEMLFSLIKFCVFSGKQRKFLCRTRTILHTPFTLCYVTSHSKHVKC